MRRILLVLVVLVGSAAPARAATVRVVFDAGVGGSGGYVGGGSAELRLAAGTGERNVVTARTDAEGRTWTIRDVGARLVIIGDGPERQTLERLAAELGIADRVRFAGHVAAPAAEYARFDVFALPSDTEQMPLSVLEAMAAGLPVVSTDVGDVRAMVAEENAPLLVPKDDAALAALDRLIAVAPPCTVEEAMEALKRIVALRDGQVAQRRREGAAPALDARLACTNAVLSLAWSGAVPIAGFRRERLENARAALAACQAETPE